MLFQLQKEHLVYLKHLRTLYVTTCDLLINEGADLQAAGLMKETPLHRASHNGKAEV